MLTIAYCLVVGLWVGSWAREGWARGSADPQKLELRSEIAESDYINSHDCNGTTYSDHTVLHFVNTPNLRRPKLPERNSIKAQILCGLHFSIYFQKLHS